MFGQETVLAIVPARGGSKRLPHKNLLPFHGKPLISWTIEAGYKSSLVDKVVVSTEDEDIKNIALDFGIDIVDRPQELATDDAQVVDVLAHAVNVLETRGEYFTWLLLLQPTSPLRNVFHINEAFKMIEKNHGAGAVSVSAAECPIEWLGHLSDDGFMDSYFEEAKLGTSSRMVTPSYKVNGAIYASRMDLFLEEKTMFLKKGIVAYVMERDESIDIDDKHDFEVAQFLMAKKLQF